MYFTSLKNKKIYKSFNSWRKCIDITENPFIIFLNHRKLRIQRNILNLRIGINQIQTSYLMVNDRSIPFKGEKSKGCPLALILSYSILEDLVKQEKIRVTNE